VTFIRHPNSLQYFNIGVSVASNFTELIQPLLSLLPSSPRIPPNLSRSRDIDVDINIRSLDRGLCVRWVYRVKLPVEAPSCVGRHCPYDVLLRCFDDEADVGLAPSCEE
jgi:hypothetical protein